MSKIKVTDNTKFFAQAFKAAIAQSLEDIGSEIAEDVASVAPVDTGALRESTDYNIETATSVAIGSQVDYAPAVELGTSRQRAQPYIRDTFARSSELVSDIVDRNIRDEIDSL